MSQPADGTPQAHQQCAETVWGTPEYILDCCRKYWGGEIPFDPATEKDNPTGALAFFTIEDDGLVQTWPEKIFINPPYGSELPIWTLKIHDNAKQGKEIIGVLPCGARFSTGYWQNNMLIPELKSQCLVNHRVKFLRPEAGQGNLFCKRTWSIPKKTTGNNYDTQVLGFNVDQDRFRDCFKVLGKVLSITIEDEEKHGKPKRRSRRKSPGKIPETEEPGESQTGERILPAQASLWEEGSRMGRYRRDQ